MEKIFYFTEISKEFTIEDHEIIKELEKRYFEMSSYQNLLTNIILTNSQNLEYYNFYFEKYVQSFEECEKYKEVFTKNIILKLCPNAGKWNIDFFKKEIKVQINE